MQESAFKSWKLPDSQTTDEEPAMLLINPSSQTIRCSVTACVYNERGQMCRLNSIQVAGAVGTPQQSYCASFKRRDDVACPV